MVYCRPATFERRAAAEGVRVCHGSSLAVRPVFEDLGARDHGATAAPHAAARQAIRNLQDRRWASGVAARASAQLAAGRERARLGLVPRFAARRAAHARLAFVDEPQRHDHVDHDEPRQRAPRRPQARQRRIARRNARRAPRRVSAARGAGSRARAFVADRSPCPRSRSRRSTPRYAARTLPRRAGDSSPTAVATAASENRSTGRRASRPSRCAAATARQHRREPHRAHGREARGDRRRRAPGRTRT